MKKNVVLWVALLITCVHAIAKTTNVEISKGSVLVYAVKEGSKSFQYTITVKEFEDGKDRAIFAWKTNEKPMPRKGICTLGKYYSLSSVEMLAGIGKSRTEELGDLQTMIIAPAVLSDFLMEDTEQAIFNIDENGKTYTINTDEGEVNVYQEKAIKYNGIDITIDYNQILGGGKNPEIGFMMESNSYKYILSNYKSATLSINLISITTPDKAAVKPVSIYDQLKLPETKDKKAVAKKMEATKLEAVKKVYPLLAKIEAYDVTNGGKDPKPFSETYDFRLSSNSENPPSAIDCFTADIQILYKQKNNYNLSGITESLSKNRLPSNVAAQLLNVYMVKESRGIPGYKPYTHWKFVRALTESQRNQLAIELEGYIKQYGFTE